MAERGCTEPIVGIIANPVSSMDIRRIIANVSGIPVATRADMVLRVLAGLGSVGIRRVLAMPDDRGLTLKLRRGLNRVRALSANPLPTLEFIDMRVRGVTEDSILAAELMVEEGVSAIIVLGGDGTHRVVASVCGDIPLAGVSTGTNNAFPESREPTIVGRAAGLVAREIIPRVTACRTNKRLNVQVNGTGSSTALVDVSVTTERWIGARALWRTDTISELYLAFAEPDAVGMSAIGGALLPVSRRESHGLRIKLASPERSPMRVGVPIVPGLFTEVGVTEVDRIYPGQTFRVDVPQGVIALDGEREQDITPADDITVNLESRGPTTIDVPWVMQHAVSRGVFSEGVLW